MKSVRWAVSASAIAILLAGCGGADPEASSKATAEGESVASAPASVKSIAKSEPLEPILETVAVQANPVPGLVKSTDADQRLAQIAKGERDPFAASAVPPLLGKQFRPSAPPSSNLPSQLPAPIKLPKIGDLPTIPVPAGLGGSPSAPPKVATSPAIPAPTFNDLANAVQITGVLNIKGKLVAIVEAPNEATSRSVQVGDYLAGGKVKVKRIELGPGGDPVVTLEQNGVEVIKSVGRTASAAVSNS